MLELNKYQLLDGEITKETTKAIEVNNKYWIAKSQIKEYEVMEGLQIVLVPTWLIMSNKYYGISSKINEEFFNNVKSVIELIKVAVTTNINDNNIVQYIVNNIESVKTNVNKYNKYNVFKFIEEYIDIEENNKYIDIVKALII